MLGVALVAGFLLEERLPVGDRDLIVIGMDFAEREEAVPVAAVIDEGGLQGRLDPNDLGQIDVAAERPSIGGFEVEFLDLAAPHHDDAGFLRMRGIDKHFVGHDELSTWRSSTIVRAHAAPRQALPQAGRHLCFIIVIDRGCASRWEALLTYLGRRSHR